MPSHLRIGLAPGIWPTGAAIRLWLLPRILQEERHSLGWPLYVYPGWCAGGCRLHSGHVSTEPLLVKIWIANRCAYMCACSWGLTEVLFNMIFNDLFAGILIHWICNDNNYAFLRFISTSAVLLSLWCYQPDRRWTTRIFIDALHQLGPRCSLQDAVARIYSRCHPWLVAAIHTTCNLHWLIVPAFLIHTCVPLSRMTSVEDFVHTNGATPLTQIKGFSHWRRLVSFPWIFWGASKHPCKPCSISFLSSNPWKKPNSKAFTTTCFTSVILRYIWICMQVPSWCGLLTGKFLMLQQKMSGWSSCSVGIFLGAKRTEPRIISWVVFCLLSRFDFSPIHFHVTGES